MLKAFKNTRIQKRENNNPKFFVPIVLSINEILIFEIIKLLSKYKAKKKYLMLASRKVQYLSLAMKRTVEQKNITFMSVFLGAELEAACLAH